MVRVARLIDSISTLPGLHFLSKYSGEILAKQSQLDGYETQLDDQKRHLRDAKSSMKEMPGATKSKYGPKGGPADAGGAAGGSGSLRRSKADGGVAAAPRTESIRRKGPSNIERLENEKAAPERERRERLRRRDV